MSNLVSIIIPIYNVENYLAKCLESVINQTYTNLEIILVDDGSTDSSGRIADEYARKDERVKVYHTANRGLSSARNFGCDHMTGMFFCFFDSDDTIEKDTIETRIKLLEENTCDICIDNTIYMNDVLRKHNSIEGGIYNAKRLLGGILSLKIAPSVWTMTYRTSVVGTARHNASVNYWEDVPFQYYAFRLAGRVIVHDKPLYNYISWEGNANALPINERVLSSLKVPPLLKKDAIADNLYPKEFAELCDFLYTNMYDKIMAQKTPVENKYYSAFQKFARKYRKEIFLIRTDVKDRRRYIFNMFFLKQFKKRRNKSIG